MIHLTRLNHHPLIVNSDLIKYVEAAPDTLITLITGEKIVVAETTEAVIERIIAFRRSILVGLNSATENARASASPGCGAACAEEGAGERGNG